MDWMTALKHHHLDEPEHVLFALAIKFQHLHPELLDWARSVPDADKLGSLLTTVEDGQIRLKSEFNKADFHIFVTALKKYGMTVEGHKVNKMKYPIELYSSQAQFEFARFLTEFESVNLDQLAKKVARAYETGEYLPKLAKFIRNNLAALI